LFSGKDCLTLSLEENSRELKLIEAIIEEITTQNEIAEVLMWNTCIKMKLLKCSCGILV